ncbi:MAG: twin-arginine translocase subunit TatC [Bacillota bacterium]|nr:twin-arginine translocase subunit TatC [Bacillota bacterium]
MDQETLLERVPPAPAESGTAAGSGGGDTGSEPVEETMTIVEHLEELRRRLIVSLFALAAGAVVGWFQSGRVIHHLAQQAGYLVFFHPTEAFFAHLEVAAAVGLIIASPIVLGQLWLFIVPGLLPKEVRFFKRWVPWVIGLFVGGMVFGYLAVYPVALKFFFRMGRDLTPALAVQRYLGFLWTWIFPFGLMFELPLVLVVLAKLGVVTAARLRQGRKYFLFGAYVIAVFIAPSELVLQLLIAIPLLVLYQLSIPIVARVKPVQLYEDFAEEGGTENDG